jgi:polysaccharide export outer membrane protein
MLFSINIPSSNDTNYYISSGDTLNISVAPADEFSKEVIVSPDGTIELPLLGSIKVSGMSIDELEKILTGMFSKYVSNPKVSITVKRFSSYRVGVIGQIQKSGYYDYNDGMKLLDLITLAGGPADYADSNNIMVYRKTKDEKGNLKEDIFNVSMDKFFEGSLDKNISLLPGDIVYIPRKKFTEKSKWISDNILPWLVIASFALSIVVITTNN